jgi:hypothetical protein
VATRLAVIYLMNRKPDRALATITSTRTAALPNELRNQRLLLEARALSDTGRPDVALEVIANVDGREAIRLRSDILWAAKRWDESAEQLELLYGDRWRDWRPLDDSERADVMRAALGYALGDDQLGLDRFGDRYSAKMADGPDRQAFSVLTTPDNVNSAEFRGIARKVAASDTLDAFLRDLRVRYPDTGPFARFPSHPAPAAPAAPAPPPVITAPSVTSALPIRSAQR